MISPTNTCLRGCTTDHARSALCTVPIGTVPGEGLAVTADRYEDDPAVVALLETPGGVAHEFTPDVARAIGQLLIAGADAAGALR